MRFLTCAILLLVLCGVDLNAQQQDSIAATPSAADVLPGAELEYPEIELTEALGALAETLGALATRLANDPELRVNAVRAASSLVTVAQVVVEEQSDVIEETLRRAADMIADIPVDRVEEPGVQQ